MVVYGWCCRGVVFYGDIISHEILGEAATDGFGAGDEENLREG